jgi:ABC-type Fe3+ transport system permease subunit
MVAMGESGLTLFQRDGFENAGLPLLFSPAGVALIQVLSLWPIPALFGVWNLQYLDSDLVDRLRLEGGRAPRMFFLPVRLIAAPVAQASLLVSVLSFNDVATPEMLQVPTFPVFLYAELNLVRDLFPLLPLIWPFFTTLVVVAVCWIVVRRALRVEQTPTREPSRVESRCSPVWSWTVLVLLLAAAPGVGAGTELASAWNDRGTIHWNLLLECLDATVHTGLGAVALTAAVCAVLVTTSPGGRSRSAIDVTFFLLFATPSPLFALFILKSLSLSGGTFDPLLDSFLILSGVCCLKFLWLPWTALQIGEDRVRTEIWDHAALSGAGRGWRRCFLIHLPMLAPYWLLGLLLVWVMTVSEVAICRILQPPGVQTLAARTVNFMHWGHDGMVASGLILLAILEVAPWFAFLALSSAWKWRSGNGAALPSA